jgi:transcriptional regulator with GAF, ATPase, and Fis domain
MLIGAYRDNEVNSAHPLMRKLEAIRQAGAMVQEIVLAPLACEDLGQLIAESLHCEPERAFPLAQLVHEKTGGNPFFSIQFITALNEDRLVVFDYRDRRWSWDLNRIHAKGYTDNVVDLMVGKLNRLPVETKNALEQLACLGNRAEFTLLQIVYQDSMEEVHSKLWEAVRTGFVFRLEESYRFVHDRVQEAAYALIPAQLRAEAHLRIGRLLAAHTPRDKREERIFEMVNQLNRGEALITSRDEREQLAEFNLIAGRRAKASSAYTSALKYFITGAALLTHDSWERRHELTFQLEFHRAECEFLTGQPAAAEERLTALSSQAANMTELATVSCLRVDLYTTLNESDRAVAVCLDYLRHLSVEWSPHPTQEEVEREYAQIWSRLGNREIEELIELPLMSDAVSLATLDVLTKVLPAALFTDANLLSLAICRAVNLSLERGNSDASCLAYGWFGQIAGPHFGNYKAGFRFGQLGYELVEKRGLKRFQARTYMVFGSHVIPWAKHVRAGRDLIHRTFEVANKIGDLCFAVYSCINLNTNLLAAGDSLVEVQREAENGLEFARKAGFGWVIDTSTAQLGLIRALRGLTPKFGSFDDGQFEELPFERHLASDPVLAQPECFYWIRKLQARFFAGDYISALAASLKAEPLLWTSPSNLEFAEYHLYGGLCRAALWDSASPHQRQQHFDALTTHHKQLEIWAENCPENFENRAALVDAEIARIEGRVLDAERLYERAIHSANANGFVHNEAVAYELAARFYATRGFDKIADAYLQEARYSYIRWGADGKVKQLEHLYPHLKEAQPARDPTSTIVASVELLDLNTVIKVSQTVSSEIVLEKLIETLMRTAIEHAGAERGLLILPQGHKLQIEAEATIGGDSVTVHLRQATIAADAMPGSILHYVVRTQESVILEDASTQNPFTGDTYIVQHHARSILCLPLMNQAKLKGVLYLENNLTPNVFTPARIAVLKVLASQAAISLENTQLYRDLEEREAKINALRDQLYRENLALRDEIDRASMFEEIIGTSKELRAVLSRIAKVAPTDSTVFITGETGTGKELIARAVHKRSLRSGRAFVSVNCAALPPSLTAAELFGHEKGAFTGADQRRLGRFELADGGTIFLDEVGELPLNAQVTLLRVLQEREFERVGGSRSIHVDVRVIAATNRDLRDAIASGSFRRDLFYRLNVVPIDVPPLRERKEDILLLLEYFVNRYASRTGKNIRSIDKKTLELFQSYSWPGNIRELQNVVERSVILSSGDVFSIEESWLCQESTQPGFRAQASQPFKGVPRSERDMIEAALAESRGRISGPSGAAAKLRTSPSTLERRIKALNIRKSQFKFG